jgi:hypothetical protein
VTSTGSFLPGAPVGNDDSPAWLRRVYDAVPPGGWRDVHSGVAVERGELVLLHAGSRGNELAEGPTRPDGLAVIGDALPWPVQPGRYAVEACTVELPEEALLAFCRFRPLTSGPA